MQKIKRVLIDGDPLVYQFGHSPQIETLEDAQAAIRFFLKRMRLKFKCSEYRIYLTHLDREHNHRFKIATTVPYKGHRKATARPEMFDALRELMISDFGAVVSEYSEADDELGINQTNETVIVSLDKDMAMIPGYVYNPITKELTFSDNLGSLELTVQKSNLKKKLKGTGFKWFCAQMIIGDAADNIKGIPRKGDVAAYNALHTIHNEARCWCKVRMMYKKAGMYPDRLIENAHLLWIAQKDKMVPMIGNRRLV